MSDDTTQLVYTLQRYEGEQIQFELRKYNGKYYIDLRLWYRKDPAEEFKPTKKGLLMTADCLPDFREGLNLLSDAFLKTKKEGRKMAAV